jgi:hypothetical protein
MWPDVERATEWPVRWLNANAEKDAQSRIMMDHTALKKYRFSHSQVGIPSLL